MFLLLEIALLIHTCCIKPMIYVKDLGAVFNCVVGVSSDSWIQSLVSSPPPSTAYVPVVTCAPIEHKRQRWVHTITYALAHN